MKSIISVMALAVVGTACKEAKPLPLVVPSLKKEGAKEEAPSPKVEELVPKEMRPAVIHIPPELINGVITVKLADGKVYTFSSNDYKVVRRRPSGK